jgi:alkyl hydroperoxide reductase 1
MAIEVGKPFPDATFAYVQYQPDQDAVTSCGIPGPLDTAKEWKGKTVVLFGVP